VAQKLRIGVIGLGEIAEVAYLPDLHNPQEGREVAWLCDLVPERLEWAGSVVPDAQVTEDYHDILEDASVDWVFVLTPLLAHAGLVRDALEAGKNAYTEKVLTMDMDEAADLVALSERRGVYLASAPILLLYPVYEYARSLVHEGALGKVSNVRAIIAHGGPDSWEMASDPGWLFRSETATKIAPLPDLGIYAFSYLAHVFGPARRVSAMASLALEERRIDKVRAAGFAPYTLRPDTKDNCLVLVEFPGGVLASVAANFASGGELPDRYEFYGTEGTLTLSYTGSHVRIQSKRPPHDEPEGLHELDLSGKTGGAKFSGVSWGPVVADHLREAAERAAEPLVGRHFTLHILEIVTAAMRAAETGRTEELETTFERDGKWGL